MKDGGGGVGSLTDLKIVLPPQRYLPAAAFFGNCIWLGVQWSLLPSQTLGVASKAIGHILQWAELLGQKFQTAGVSNIENHVQSH